MTNLFVADANTKTEDMFEDMDLDTCLKHPRVTKVTIMPDGTLVAELSAPTEANDIIRKTEGLHKGNKTGFRGVSIFGEKYRADIQTNGVQRYLGLFDTMQDAVKARIIAELDA